MSSPPSSGGEEPCEPEAQRLERAELLLDPAEMPPHRVARPRPRRRAAARSPRAATRAPRSARRRYSRSTSAAGTAGARRASARTARAARARRSGAARGRSRPRCWASSPIRMARGHQHAADARPSRYVRFKRSGALPLSCVAAVASNVGRARASPAAACRPAPLRARTRGLRRRTAVSRDRSRKPTSDEHEHAGAGDRVRGARRAERDQRAAEQVADAGHRRAERLEQADDPRLVVGRRRLLQRGDHRDPLDPVAGAADDRDQARDEQRVGRRHAEVGDADRGRRDDDQRRAPTAA